MSALWLIDANNVFGSRPDGWWNDPQAAGTRLAQRVAEWARGHADEVVLVFDGPIADDTRLLAGGNLRVEVARRRGRDAADDLIVELAERAEQSRVVTADRRLGQRLMALGTVELVGVGRFRELIGY